MPRARQPLDYAAYLVVRILVCVVQATSLTMCRSATQALAQFAWSVLRLRRSVIDGNLQTAFPQLSSAERSAIAVAMWQHLFLMVCEIAHAPRKLHRTNWRDFSAMPQMPRIVRRLLDDRPLILLSGHWGNFELGGYMLGLHGFPSYTVARRLDNKYLDRWVKQFRGATGQYMLDKEGVSGTINQVLDRGELVVLLGDQYAGDKACWTEFFGRPASTHKAVAMFTLSAEAPTVVGGVYRRGGPFEFEMEVADLHDPRADSDRFSSPKSLVAWYSQNLEKLIRIAPEQYWWVHRRWKGTPPRRRTRKAA